MEGRLQITLFVIWTFSTQDMTSLPKLLQSHVKLSLPIAVDVLQSSLLQVSLLQLMLPVLHVQIRCHSRAVACHLSLALPHLAINDSHPKIVVVHVTPPAIVPIAAAFLRNALANDSHLATSLATDGDSHQGIPLLQGDRDSLQGILPLQSGSDSLQGIPPLQSDSDSLQGIPLLQSDGDSLQGILIHLSVSIHPVPRLVMVLLRDPHRGLLLPVHLRLLGKIRKLMNLLPPWLGL